MTTREELKAAMTGFGIPGYYEALSPFIRNSIRITPEATEDIEIPLGYSKLGGLPDLPEGVQWPWVTDIMIPMSFICQINLAQAAPFDLDGLLPREGMLYFFYDCSMDGMPWGYDPKDCNGWKILYAPADAVLARQNAPEELKDPNNGWIFAPASLGFEARLEVPAPESDLTDSITYPEDEDNDLFWGWADEQCGDLCSKLLGHADPVQGGMELECEYVTNNIYLGDPSGYQEGRRRGLAQKKSHWRLLMQIDSHEELGMMWGDAGRLYVWITEEDLMARNFDKCWLILQCG